MTRDVNLTITGIQTDQDGHDTVTELRVRGQYYEKDGSRYLLYEEQDSDSGTVTKNTIKIKDCLLELSRSGSIRSRMLFQAGKSHQTSYITPYGALLLEVHTESMRNFWSDNNGTIQIDYYLAAENEILSRNKLSIKIVSEKL